MRYIIMFLAAMKYHPLVSFLALVTVFILCFALFPRNLKKVCSFIAVIPLIIYFINLFAGHLFINPLLERFGDKGMGMVTAVSETSSAYNDQPVTRYDVSIKSNTINPVSTYCLTSDFNIAHPESWNSFAFPSTGMNFNVRFLKEYPRAFVIIANDDSEYSKWLSSAK